MSQANGCRMDNAFIGKILLIDLAPGFPAPVRSHKWFNVFPNAHLKDQFSAVAISLHAGCAAPSRTSTDLEPPLSDWVYLMECSAPDCDNAQCGDTPEEAARLWNFSNPDWSGNVPTR
jgi:hypothetical protein